MGLYVYTLWKDCNVWMQWEAFLTWMCINKYLKGIQDHIPFLKIFDERVCSGVLAAKQKPLQKRIVD